MRIKLPYRLFPGMPTDNARSYLCFSLIEPGSDCVSSLCLDEGAFKSVLRRCKTEQNFSEYQQARLFRPIHRQNYFGSVDMTRTKKLSLCATTEKPYNKSDKNKKMWFNFRTKKKVV